jgi:glycosyltransferase involved in cell wall biosynthesis
MNEFPVKRRVLVICDYFSPGYRAGGPTQSVKRVIQVEKDFEFRVLTSDHDYTSNVRYEVAKRFSFVRAYGADVAYLKKSPMDLAWSLVGIMRWKPEIYYLNSLFSTSSLLFLGLRRILPKGKLIIAPRGQCHPDALLKSSIKKKLASLYLKFVLPSDSIFEASSSFDSSHIKQWIGKNKSEKFKVVESANIPPSPASRPSLPDHDSNEVVVSFASRIVSNKGLKEAITLVQGLRTKTYFNIYGEIQDQQYWIECQSLLKNLPKNINWEYRENFTPDDVNDIFGQSDVFLFPTKFENFGHIIGEALAVGCPVLTTNQVFWAGKFTCDGIATLGNPKDQQAALMRMAFKSMSDREELRRCVWKCYSDWFERSSRTTILQENR